jgi:phage tail sheath protein FI
MAKYVSPGSYFVEVDISDYPPSVNSSVVGIVGFASKGPIAGKDGKKATLITSQENLVDIFGKPSSNIAGQGIEGALEILEATNSLYFIRCASTDAAEASAAVNVGYCPALSVCTTPSGGYLGTADVGNMSYKFVVDAYDNNRKQVVTSKTFLVPSGTVASATAGGTSTNALRTIWGGSVDGDRVGVFGTDASAFAVAPMAGSGTTLTVSMYGTGPADSGNYAGVHGLQPISVSGNIHPDYKTPATAVSSVTVSGGTFQNLFYWTRALYSGDGYDEGTTPAGDTSGNSIEIDIAGGNNVFLSVNEEGVASEQFQGGTTSSVFLEDVVGKTVATATSDNVIGYFTSAQGNAAVGEIASLAEFYTKAANIGNFSITDTDFDLVATDGSGAPITLANPRFVKPVQGTYSLSGGDSGIPTTSADKETLLIGTTESDGGLTGIEALGDPDVPVKIALVPNFSELDGVQNALITKAESMQSFLALISPPLAIGRTQDAIDWSNGQSTDRTAAVNSSYAACYWPWVKTFSVFDGKDTWFAPEIYGARQMVVTDGVARPWFAPAGLARGRLTKPVDVEVVLNQGDRDSLYSGGNIINPITKFTQDGIVIFGQRTTQRKSTALDRINVRRLLIDLRDTIIRTTRQFAFEPNDRFTWDRVVTTVAPLLDEIKRERGINEFKVICDETTNTPVRVDRNELWCKVLLKPTKTAEIVIFEVNVTNQSAQIGN